MKKNMPLALTLSISAAIVLAANLFTGALGTAALGFMTLLACVALVVVPISILAMKVLGKFMGDQRFIEHCALDEKRDLGEFRNSFVLLRKHLDKEANILVRMFQYLLCLAWLFTFASHGMVVMCAVYIAVFFMTSKFRGVTCKFCDEGEAMFKEIDRVIEEQKATEAV